MKARILRTGAIFPILRLAEDEITLSVPDLLGGPVTLPIEDVEVLS